MILDDICTDSKGRYLFARKKDTKDVLACIYAPSGYQKEKERSLFFQKINTLLNSYTKNDENIILLGDFNITINRKDRQTSTQNCNSKNELLKLITDQDLEDQWRLEHHDKEIYTHYHAASKTQARLDRAYTSVHIRQNISITHDMISLLDHYNAVCLERKTNNFKRGKGYWILITQSWRTKNV